MAEKRKTCRQRTLELMAEPEKSHRFPMEIDAPAPHKVGHAKTIPTPSGTLKLVQCKCPSRHWVTSSAKKWCFICGAKRVELRAV